MIESFVLVSNCLNDHFAFHFHSQGQEKIHQAAAKRVWYFLHAKLLRFFVSILDARRRERCIGRGEERECDGERIVGQLEYGEQAATFLPIQKLHCL